MQLIKFENYAEYIETQRITDQGKKIHGRGRRGRPRACCSPEETQRMVDWLNSREKSPGSGICHGARHGWEVKWFQDRFPDASIIGTDLFLKDDAEVPCVQWDFHDPNPDWIGSADFVYSNALDHAYDPGAALRTWVDQLKLGGHLFLVWSHFHIKAKRGDCFGAYLHEYMQMIDRCLPLVDLIYLGGHKVIVVGEKPASMA